MTTLGQLRSKKTIEQAMREIRFWLSKLKIDGLSIQTNYDSRMNISLVKFKYNNKDYEFRSTKQANYRLNMWGIAKVMEAKVRSSIMGIEDFEKSMKSYLQLEDRSGFKTIGISADEEDYVRLGAKPSETNEELKKKYIHLIKTFHPDNALSNEAKIQFQKEASSINQAWTNIQRERQVEEKA